MTALAKWFRGRKTRMPGFYDFLIKEIRSNKKPSLITVQRVIYQDATDNYNIRDLALKFLKDEIRREKEFEQKVKDALKDQRP